MEAGGELLAAPSWVVIAAVFGLSAEGVARNAPPGERSKTPDTANQPRSRSDPNPGRTLVAISLGQAGSIELVKELAPFEGPAMVKPLL